MTRLTQSPLPTAFLRRWAMSLVCFLTAASLDAGAQAPVATPEPSLIPRAAAAKHLRPKPEAERIAQRIIVKFHEGTRVRLRDGSLRPLDRSAEEAAALTRLRLSTDRLRADVAAVHQLVGELPEAGGLRRLLPSEEPRLDSRRLAAEARSGRRLADLNLYYEITLAPGTRAGEVEAAVAHLNALPSVEIAYLPGRPVLAGFLSSSQLSVPGGSTPDFRALQGYRNAAPEGIDADYAWGFTGGKGAGVEIIDLEESIFAVHEDFPPISPLDLIQLVTPDPDRNYCSRQHAVAVAGEVVGQDNDLGVAGIAPDARYGFESYAEQIGAQPTDISAAIDRAGNFLDAGDVLLIEVQLVGVNAVPSSACRPCSDGSCRAVPVEYDQANFDVISLLTAEGKIVVEPAGNGLHSLDHPNYNGIFDRAIRDSGAIMVGASDPRLGNGQPACFTNAGSRVDVHGWGRDVVTSGYGDLFGCENDPPSCTSFPQAENCSGGLDEGRRYTAAFAGTSSASPIVTGAAASLQGIAQANLSRTLTPAEMRDLLVGTGTPQAPGTPQIGPLPDLRAAVDALLQPNQPPEATPDIIRLSSCDGSTTIPFDTLILNDSDPDGDSLFVCGSTPPAFGTLIPGRPDPIYQGTARVCELGSDWSTYTVNDRVDCSGLEDSASVIFVAPVDGPLLFEDFFEGGDLSAWFDEMAFGGNRVSVTPAAALSGSLGLEVRLAGGPTAIVVDRTAAGTSQYTAAFLFDPNSLVLVGEHNLLAARRPGNIAFQIRLRENAGTYQAQLRAWENSGALQVSEWVDLIDGTQRLEVEWWKSGLRRDSGISLKIDGQIATTILRLDIDGMVLDEVRLGATVVQPGTQGSYFIDDFRSWTSNGSP